MKNFVDPYYQGQSKVNYNYDKESGEIKKVQVHGWEPEFDSTERAWEEIRADLKQCRKAVLAGKATTLEYYMKKRMLEPSILAQEAGVCTFFTKRHLRSPTAWKSLSLKTKEKYAVALGISCGELEHLPEGDV